MINWIKSFFETKPGLGAVAISSKAADEAYAKRIEEEIQMEREWIYMGDGMMEEVIKRKPKVKAYDEPRYADTTPIGSDIATMALVYSAYASGSPSSDSGSSYDSGSCDSGSSSCD